MTQNNVSNKEEPVKAQEMSRKETDYPSNGKNNRKIVEQFAQQMKERFGDDNPDEFDVANIAREILEGFNYEVLDSDEAWKNHDELMNYEKDGSRPKHIVYSEHSHHQHLGLDNMYCQDHEEVLCFDDGVIFIIEDEECTYTGSRDIPEEQGQKESEEAYLLLEPLQTQEMSKEETDYPEREKQLLEEVSNCDTMNYANEKHTRPCIDELITEIKEQLDFIETQWKQKDVDCELIKDIKIAPEEIGYIISGPDLALEDIKDLIVAIGDKVEQIDEKSIRVVKP